MTRIVSNFKYGAFGLFLLIPVFSIFSREPAQSELNPFSEEQSAEPNIETLTGFYQKKARKLGLSKKRYWHLLLHYEEGLFGIESEADGAPFFLAKDGKTNPEAELNALIEGLFSLELPSGNPELHPYCRFPARRKWVMSELGIQTGQIKDPGCRQMDFIQKDMNVESISIVFSSYYMNAPASMFGHTLMRFSKADEPNELLDYAANYAANPGDLDPFRYAIYGLLGGYPGYFSLLPYHAKVLEYNDMEARDMWDYKLNLTAEERQVILDHLWELSQTNFDYFYMTENCSYHLLSLIEVARPELELRSEFSGWVLPGETVKLLLEQEGLVAERTLRPSISAVIYGYSDLMTDEERKVFYDLIDEEKFSMDADLPADRQALILDTAIDVYRMRSGSSAEVYSEFQNEVFQYRSLVDGQRPPLTDEVSESAPEFGHEVLNVRIGGGGDSLDSFAEIRFRPLFHDLLNPNPGFAPYSEIEFLSFKARNYAKEGAHLQKFSFVRGISLNPYDRIMKSGSYLFDFGSDTMVLEDEPASFIDRYFYWQLYQYDNLLIKQYAYDNFLKEPERVRYSAYNSDILYGISFGRELTVSFMGGAIYRRLLGATSRQKADRLYGQAFISFLYGAGFWKGYLNVRYMASDSVPDDFIAEFQNRFLLALNHEIRLEFQGTRYNAEAVLSYAYSF